MRTGIYIGHRKSSYAFDLARASEVLVLRRVPPVYMRRGGVMVNWGCSAQLPVPDNVRLVNAPEAVRLAVNKLRTFRTLGHVDTIAEWTECRQQAFEWQQAGSIVVVRHRLQGSCGAGIQLVNDIDQPMPEARLYTKYFNGAHEYRVHVFPDDTGMEPRVQQKRRRHSADTPEGRSAIRNGGDVWTFCVHNVVPPSEELVSACKRAVRALGLDFGAVDVRCSVKNPQRFRILEINTAPGIEATALGWYVEMVQNFKDR